MSEPTIVSRSGKAIEGAALKKFAASLVGNILRPGEKEYHRARIGWTGLLDPRSPAIIVCCASTEDVVRSIDFARTNQLEVAVRSGGHSLSGDSFCDGGVVIDVSAMKAIEVDPKSNIARGDAGLTAGEFDHATQAFGLATVLGECSAVGIAGFTLGGGLGRLMGKYGAGCDNLLSAEIVNADGNTLRASAQENPDLFWALRGGGGNFGVVTSLEYRLHPVPEILGGTLTYPISNVREVLTFLDDFMPSVPDEMDIVIDIGNGGLMTFAPGVMEPIINLAVSYCGDLAKGERVLRPLRSFRRPTADTIRTMPYLEMQALSDIRPLAAFGSSGGSMALEGGFVARLREQGIDTIISFIEEAPSGFWITAEHYLHGAVCRTASEQVAFALRKPGYSTRVFSAWREPGQADLSIDWVRRLTAALKPLAGGAMYLNYLTDPSGSAVEASYGNNFARLVALKSKYDPTNFFHSNRNIPTA
jgi:hypothetical protein